MTKWCLALALACASCGSKPPAETGFKEKGPKLSLSVQLLEGGNVELAQYRGEVVILHFFVTANDNVFTDVDQLKELDDENIIGISLDSQPRAFLPGWRKATRATYLLGLGSESKLDPSIAPLSAIPTTLVIDKQGRVFARRDGPLKAGELRELVTAAKKSQSF